MSASSSTPKPPRGGYPPIPLESWEALVLYLRQALTHLEDPRRPQPDINFLAVAPFGPFRSIRVGVDPGSGEPCIAFEAQNPLLRPRTCAPEVFLAAALLLAFGGGLSVNDTGDGLGYIKLFSDRQGITLLRLVTGAGPGEVARQRGDYRSHNPRDLSKTTADVEEGRPRGSPFRGRREAIATARDYYRRNHPRSRIPVSEVAYVQILEDAFRLLDRERP